VLTVLLTSPRVAAGLLSSQAWLVLRSAVRVLAGADHPQLPALASAGVSAEVLDAPGAPADATVLAGLLSSVAVAADGPVAWLAPPGELADAGLLSALSVPFTLLHGSHDLPGAHLIDVVAVMDTLRTSCPWDREQTHSSLMRYLLEEAYEAIETVEGGDLTALREELGDVLLQVAFHSRIAAERPADAGGYTIDDVADTLVAKLIRRHPHVFAGVSVSSAEDVSRNWDDIKKAERAQRSAASVSGVSGAPVPGPSVLDGVPFGQPALSLAAQLQRRARHEGISMTHVDKVRSSSLPSADGQSPLTAQQLGDELMRLVAGACEAGLDPELALRSACRLFADRVRAWERSPRS
jgi:XTP/dITP diphosphohydrolase